LAICSFLARASIKHGQAKKKKKKKKKARWKEREECSCAVQRMDMPFFDVSELSVVGF
jgi:hypothetical protein